jgi:hypothetical protein
VRVEAEALETSAGGNREPPILPQADVGVLLVHGIGNHLKGATLTAFGQPLLNWLKEWLRGGGDRQQLGEVVVDAAQFAAPEAPAYALVHVQARSRTGNSEAKCESWLFCEGWWGATVQPPPSLDLLRWMWTRGPLLIYWHFYIRQTAQATAGDERKPPSPVGAFFSVAVVLAGFCQLIVGLAMLLWLIPIGPWRRKIVAAVRALTLTLGDSYVLEQDIQRAALAESVRSALEWLSKRVQRVAIIAHSQGAAIAHEALRQKPPSNAGMFISVGSGLEKLHFLREVAFVRDGRVAATLLVPLLLGGASITIGAQFSTVPRWATALGGVLLFSALVCGAALIHSFGEYKQRLRQAIPDLALRGLLQRRWIDLYASEDVVPMNKGSLLNEAPFLKRRRVCNERSYVIDHISYFHNANDCLARLWQNLARLSRLRLFEMGEHRRLERFAWLHQASARAVYLSRVGLFIALVVSGIFLRHPLLNFGRSTVEAVKGTAAEDWLKPVQALASSLAWIIQRLWKPDTLSPDTVANALFGLLLLFALLSVWWLTFRGLWLARCAARWRKACRGDDVLRDQWQKIRFVLGWIALLAFGYVPIFVVTILVVAPELFTFESFGQAVAMALAILVLLVAVFYAGCAPLMAEGMWQNKKKSLLSRTCFPFLLVGFLGMLLGVSAWLWPHDIAPAVGECFAAGFLILLTAAWQIYGVLRLRKQAPGFAGAVAVIPVMGALLCLWLGGTRLSRPVGIYLGLTAVLLIGIFFLRQRRKLLAQ